MSIYDITVATVVWSLVTLSSKRGDSHRENWQLVERLALGSIPSLYQDGRNITHAYNLKNKHTKKVEGYDVPHHQIKAAGREIQCPARVGFGQSRSEK